MELLLKKGAKVNGVDGYGITPLLAACKAGHLEVVMSLLRAGADKTMHGPRFETPLEVAMENDRYPIIDLLLK